MPGSRSEGWGKFVRRGSPRHEWPDRKINSGKLSHGNRGGLSTSPSPSPPPGPLYLTEFAFHPCAGGTRKPVSRIERVIARNENFANIRNRKSSQTERITQHLRSCLKPSTSGEKKTTRLHSLPSKPFTPSFDTFGGRTWIQHWTPDPDSFIKTDSFHFGKKSRQRMKN